MTAGKFTSCYNAVKAQSHYDAGGAPVRDQASTGLNRGPYRDEPVLHRDEPWTTGDNRGSTGSIKMFNTSGMNRESPGRTGNDRLGTGNNRDCIGNNRYETFEYFPGGVPVVPG
ncbi:hypothetical protein DPMN_000408 [Dreissena polymorpha]|uniref:Uncharacterized protein n=1 Tax=Dreissena polymorpha TaxID=45954 RepID=A0A9D4QSH6_DREPO|nr:hypothetical protein DPMN_131778 [Dreissena polymorpha]KAH3841007.1 hypothetical protein DPMN_114466 [Dreissena polymorpha]KAH3876562.1 hypothetical protein DPMN_000408 [Dreissena polymorpha]